jgi:uncharacterized protein
MRYVRKILFFMGVFCFWLSLSIANFSPIQDEVGLVSSGWVRDRIQLLMSVYQSSQVQIQIVVAKSTRGKSIEAYSMSLVEQMQLGKKQTDRGLLMLLVPSQREVRIEVGQGLEGDIPDVVAKRIIEDHMIPFFRKNQFEAGIDAGLNQILAIISPLMDRSQLTKGLTHKPSELPLWAQVLIFIFILIFWLMGPRIGFIGPLGRGGPFGGIGGGGWSGGGGGFSGGGASGRW